MRHSGDHDDCQSNEGAAMEIVAPTNALFIHGRKSIHNVIICQEVVHTLSYKKSRRGRMVLKLYLEKSYDRMERSFIEKTLRDTSISISHINVVMGLLCKSS